MKIADYIIKILKEKGNGYEAKVSDYLDESGLTTTLQERFMSILKQYCDNLVEQEQIKMILFKNSLRK